MKVILMLVVGLVVGIALTIGFLMWSGGRAAQKNKDLVQNEIMAGKLFAEVEKSPAEIGKLADQKQTAEATEMAEEMLGKIDQALELNQTLIDGTSGSKQEIFRKKHEIFQAQREIMLVVVQAIEITDMRDPSAQKLQQELKDWSDKKMALAEELQDMMLEQ
jgi:MFS superfamily sulfate permease-like transporter